MENFSNRHLGPRAAELAQMCRVIGYPALPDLVAAVWPDAQTRTLAESTLAPKVSSSPAEAQARLAELASQNNPLKSLIGQGFYFSQTEAVLRRGILENPAWYTAYTPYQPEISQGRLEALLVFQDLVSELTALPISGASLLDEPTAVAEAVTLARRANRRGRRVLVDSNVFAATKAVVSTRCVPLQIEVAEADLFATDHGFGDVFAVVVQVPDADGRLRTQAELQALATAVHAGGGLVIAVADPLALTLISPPGEWGADLAAGSMQRYGLPLFFGGPHAGYLAVRHGLERQLPGRIVGLSKDRHGRPALRLALQSREQHIRRERATSNICTSQVLLAVLAAMYAVYHGRDGLRAKARAVHEKARIFAGWLSGHYDLAHESFFDTLLVFGPADELVSRARQAGYHLARLDDNRVGLAFGEDLTDDDLRALAEVFAVATDQPPAGGLADPERPGDFLNHPVFTSYHSETAMMRYLSALANRDFALNRGMIPLGSCTMKLSSAWSLEPIMYPGFANLHPYVPVADSVGTRTMIAELEDWLAALTGYDAVSVQPNAGSQGELAGLLAIRAYHLARGDSQRNVCLIPASAHGTNAASAAMAGFQVVVVKTAIDGSVDLEHLRDCLTKYGDVLAVAMITFPSTHGVFEETASELCDLVHAAGGQVYIDGANGNALLGCVQPGRIGGDATHLNLHKTFSIPHGGGGPGVGPICVKEHLRAFLPSHPLDTSVGAPTSFGPISGAPFGSAGVLPIVHAYLAMSGPDVATYTAAAIASANYLATRLGAAYPVLYTGPNGLVAHECILDLREIKAQTGISVDDVAKRLIDYGFHAPTMSFPVPGTLMVEPTESEPLSELDRFIDAMLQIRAEIAAVADGRYPADDNPLVNAPHPAAEIAGDWPHPYSREVAAFPMPTAAGPLLGQGSDKYWPPVARIDSAYGDRNFVCTCDWN